MYVQYHNIQYYIFCLINYNKWAWNIYIEFHIWTSQYEFQYLLIQPFMLNNSFNYISLFYGIIHVNEYMEKLNWMPISSTVGNLLIPYYLLPDWLTINTGKQYQRLKYYCIRLLKSDKYSKEHLIRGC